MQTVFVDGIWSAPVRMRHLATHFSGLGLPNGIVYEYDTSGRKRLEDLALGLIKTVETIGPFFVVAHSMGGLIVRTALKLRPDLPLRRAVFINSPHQGSWLAFLLPLPGVRQMCPGQSFMRELERTPWNVPSLAIWCPADLMVVPGWSACWSKASHRACCLMPSHMWPVISKSWHRRMADFLLESNP